MIPSTKNAAVPTLAAGTAQHHCPRCGSARVHRSHRKGALDHVLSLAGARMRRCHDCRSRQAWFGWLAVPVGRGSGPADFLRQAAVAGGGFLLCLLLLWWMLARFSALSG